jgi:hypothetical protein
MDKKLWTAIQGLLDEAEYAITVLDRYQDYNAAMVAYTHLMEAVRRLEALMPEDPETPLETAIARAEYEEDR